MRIAAVSVLIASLLSAGSIVKSIRFETADITFETNHEFDIVRMDRCSYTSQPGNPSLPEFSYNLLVPPTAEVTGIEVKSYKVKDIPGSFNIFPAQPALPLSETPGGAICGAKDGRRSWRDGTKRARSGGRSLLRGYQHQRPAAGAAEGGRRPIGLGLWRRLFAYQGGRNAEHA